MPRTMKRGDTWPPITGTVRDADGPVPLGGADEVLLVLRSDDRRVEAVVAVVDPDARRGEPDAGKWSYTWQDGDTAYAGTYAVEIQVTWDAATTPPRIQTFPNSAGENETLTIDNDLNPETS